jgi:hypothetical protein
MTCIEKLIAPSNNVIRIVPEFVVAATEHHRSGFTEISSESATSQPCFLAPITLVTHEQSNKRLLLKSFPKKENFQKYEFVE